MTHSRSCDQVRLNYHSLAHWAGYKSNRKNSLSRYCTESHASKLKNVGYFLISLVYFQRIFSEPMRMSFLVNCKEKCMWELELTRASSLKKHIYTSVLYLVESMCSSVVWWIRCTSSICLRSGRNSLPMILGTTKHLQSAECTLQNVCHSGWGPL